MGELIHKGNEYYLKWEFDTIPIALFKYTKLENLVKILSTNKFLFNNPTKFDDINDCRLTMKIPRDINKIRLGLRHHSYCQNNFIRIEYKALDIFNNIDYYDELNRQTTIKRIKTYGIQCFTHDSNNFKMWENYADQHKGVSIGLMLLQDDKFFATTHNVTYVSKYPILNPFDLLDMEKNELIKVITTKHIDYSYEKEVRLWKSDNQIYYSFNKKCIYSIVLGYKLNNNMEVLRKVVELILDNGYENVRLWQALLLPDSKSLIYQGIDYRYEQ